MPRRQTTQGRVRVVVADGQAIDRAGLASLLATHPLMRVVGEAATAAETVERCRALAPDVLVLTPGLPAVDAAGALHQVRAALPEQRVVVLSERGWSDCVVLNPPEARGLAVPHPATPCADGTDCLELSAAHGAHGTVRRSADPRALYDTVLTVAAGGERFEPRGAAPFGIAPAGRSRALSARESEVGALIVQGRSNKEIAGALGISEPTVKKHVSGLLAKIGVQDRLQAGLYFARRPLLLRRVPARPRGAGRPAHHVPPSSLRREPGADAGREPVRPGPAAPAHVSRRSP